MKKRSFFLILVSFLSVTIFSIGIGIAQDGVARIGCSISLTGKLSNEGRLTKDGYEFYKALINKKGGLNVGGKRYRVDIKYYDDESNVQTSTKLIEKLITDDKVDSLVGPYGSGPSFATSAIAEKYKKVMMLPLAASPSVFLRGFKYIFGILSMTDVYFTDILEEAMRQNPKPKTVAQLWKNDLANQSLAVAIPGICKKLGLELIYDEKFSPDASDFSAEFSVIKAKNPDIFLFQSQIAQFIIAVKQMKDMKLNAKMIANGIAPPQPDFVKSLGKDAEHMVAPVDWARFSKYRDDLFGDSKNYSDGFKQMFGYEPEYHNAAASSGLQILGLGIEKAGSLDSEKVREGLALLNAKTFWGTVKFDETGRIAGRTMMVGQVQNGRFVLTYPVEAAETKLVYPKPGW